MKNNKLNIKNNISLSEYQKAHKGFSHKLLSFSEKEIKEFDKVSGVDNYLLKGKKWAKIDGKYYQLPKTSVFNWFRNLGTAGKTAVSLLTCGVVGGAVASPFIVNALNNNGQVKTQVIVGKGLKKVEKTVDTTTGAIVFTATLEKETEGINKDSIEVSFVKGSEKTVLEEDQYSVANDNQVIVEKDVQEENEGAVLTLAMTATVTDTPENYNAEETQDPETGEEVAVVEVETENDAEEICVPAKAKTKSGKKKKVNEVKIKEKSSSKDKLKKVVLSDDIKSVKSSNGKKGAFEDRKNLEYVRMPDNVPTFEDYTFRNCDSLKHVKGGMNTKKFGNECFSGSYKLEKVQAKKCETVGEKCFFVSDDQIKKGCEPQLQSAYFSDNLVTFEADTFHNQRNLKSVKGGKNGKEIKDNCYKNCFALEEVEMLKSENLRKVGSNSFRNTSLKELRINDKIDAKTEGQFFNSFKHCMLSEVYVDNYDFANLPAEDHDFHGAIDNAKNVYVAKNIKLGEKSGIKQRFKLNGSNDKYNIYSCSNDDEYKHQTYRNYEYDEELKYTLGYRYCGNNEENVKMPKFENDTPTHVNSHGFRDKKALKKVDLRQNEKECFIESIGNDMEFGCSFRGCDQLEDIKGMDKVSRICGYSFMGTNLKTFNMPMGVSIETLGKGAFKDHKSRNMELHLEDNNHNIWNAKNDDSCMFEASAVIYLTANTTPDENSYLGKNKDKYDEKIEKIGEKEVKKLTKKAK